ncbi:hypothetical protein MCOR25_004417 [Pyricularia grisea]|nr:hypothetical protein MCOR25_004417 [Pyricularia grisea]
MIGFMAVVFCPTSRGIGHHLTRALLRRTTLPILATCRSDPDGTKAALLAGLPDDGGSLSSRLHMARVDVTDEDSVRAAAESCASKHFPRDGGHHLRLAFALPGVLRVDKAVEQVDYAQTLDSFRINTLGPLVLMKHFARFLPRGRSDMGGAGGGGGDDKGVLPNHSVWVNMSARVGSVQDNRQGGWYTYRASKAAVNSLTRTFDWQLRNRAGRGEAAFAVAYHPGTVKTDFSKEFWSGAEARGDLQDPDKAAERMLDVILGLKPEQRGRIWDWKGTEVPP